jgi:hypothetical protein
MRGIVIRGYSKWLSRIALLVTLVSFLAFPVAVYAIDDPTTPPSVNAVYVYEFSDGSVGVLIDYYLDYTAPFPDETVTEAYLAVFVDTDGTTQLKSVAPYTFVDSGYGRGLVWIPFTDAEVTAAGLDIANIALYRIWLTGNPTLTWAGDPPKTITTIDQWVTTNVPETLASRILYYADVLELAWTLDMIEYTADGNKLTAVGSSYFENVISDCRTIAPGAFSDTTSDPDYITISYDTAFGATATSGTATVTGSPQILPVPTAGLARNFNGVADYISVAHDASQLLTTGGSIEAWIRPVGGAASPPKIVDKSTGLSGNNGFSLSYASDDNQVAFRINAGTSRVSASNSVSVGVYSHVVATWDGTGLVTLYVNGIQSGTSGISADPTGITTTNALTIGNRSTATDRTFNGDIDEVRIYNRVLSLVEIAYSYNAGSGRYIPYSNSGLVAGFHLNDTGATATAYSGNNGTISGTTVVTNTIAIGTAITVVTTGTIIIDLAQWTSGNITDDTGTLFGGPIIDLYPGVNTLTITANGTFTTELEVIDTAVIYERGVTGTGFDLTDLATAFGMSRWMLSGLVWIFVTIVACAVTYAGSKHTSFGDDTGTSKTVTFLLLIMLIIGNLLGLLHPLVTSFAVIVTGAFIGYILFFRSETLHKGMMFMMWMFVITSIAGNIAASGQSGITTTRLTDNITASETDSIPVASTLGFPDAGIIIIGDEQITYPDKDDTHFVDTTFNDIVRGSSDTDNVSHAINSAVRTKESYMLNASLDYKIARITDSAGALAYIALPFLLFDLVLTFFKLPLEFLGTDLAILTYVWMVVAVGMIVGFVVALVGGRRV